ncbi:MAG: SpoVR-like family protein [Ignavibacteria bacterium]|nr:SpoVR-like family protein [Ignavibacteria bacterium]
MDLIDQHTKEIMEDCKVRAHKAGLEFGGDSLEYIVKNRDLIELSPKVMIPTLYDYWVHDVEVLKEQGKYKISPSNPYETVINSRPAISFYNDNNPDWLNTMIFYHVLGHIDFFRNNTLFENTWTDDFVGQALADKRLIVQLRSEKGRWLDYAIEFSRSIDNICGYFEELYDTQFPQSMLPESRLDYYFNIFLQERNSHSHPRLPEHEIFKEIERFNQIRSTGQPNPESNFLSEVKLRFPEFQALYDKFNSIKARELRNSSIDILEFVRDNSSFLNKESNLWMKEVMTIVRNTSLYFSPQIRTKIINEGWASYWHEELFGKDERIAGHEIDFAVINSKVTSISRVGLNPYAIGLRLIQNVEDLADRGKLSLEFQEIFNSENRESFNRKTGTGRQAIFELRKNFSDFMLVNTFVTQDFVDKYDLFVVGRRYNEDKSTYEYYVKSRKAEDYKQMLIDSMYHPPKIDVDLTKTTDSVLYLTHKFEGRQLVREFIPDVLLGIEYLWSGCSGGNFQVQLETTEIYKKKTTGDDAAENEYKRVLYSMKEKKIGKEYL